MICIFVPCGSYRRLHDRLDIEDWMGEASSTSEGFLNAARINGYKVKWRLIFIDGG